MLIYYYYLYYYCNSLLYGVPTTCCKRLQSVQNTAARPVIGTRRCEHITPVLQKLGIGFLSVDELNSSSHALCISRWLDKHRSI